MHMRKWSFTHWLDEEKVRKFGVIGALIFVLGGPTLFIVTNFAFPYYLQRLGERELKKQRESEDLAQRAMHRENLIEEKHQTTTLGKILKVIEEY
ncbi:MAG: hypothetical protein Kow0026_22150 [Oricola sp.]